MCVQWQPASPLQLLLCNSTFNSSLSTYLSIHHPPPTHPPSTCLSIHLSIYPSNHLPPPPRTTVFLRPSLNTHFTQISVGFYFIRWAPGNPSDVVLPHFLFTTCQLYFLFDPCSGTLYTHMHVQTYTRAHTLSPLRECVLHGVLFCSPPYSKWLETCQVPGRNSMRVYWSNQLGKQWLHRNIHYGFKGEIRKCIRILFPKQYLLHTWLHLSLDMRESTTSVWKEPGKNRILGKLTAINYTVSERILVTCGSVCWQWKYEGNAKCQD